MFYISNISGAQEPYTAELFRLQREQALQQSQAASAEAAAAEAEYAASTEGEPSQNAATSGRVSTPGSPAAGPAGQAAASVMYRSRRSGEAGTEEGEGEEVSRRQRLNPRAQKPREETIQVSRSRGISSEDEFEASEAKATHAPLNPYQKLNEPNRKRQPAILSSQIMASNIETLHAEDKTEKARELFQTKRFRHIPVVSDDGQLIGIVSDRDFIGDEHKGKFVKDIMTSPVLSARPETPIRKVAEIMFQEQIGAMPIVSEDGQLSGMLTRTDILRTVVNEAPLELWV